MNKVIETFVAGLKAAKVNKVVITMTPAEFGAIAECAVFTEVRANRDSTKANALLAQEVLINKANFID